jgi:hypothetical protein
MFKESVVSRHRPFSSAMFVRRALPKAQMNERSDISKKDLRCLDLENGRTEVIVVVKIDIAKTIVFEGTHHSLGYVR